MNRGPVEESSDFRPICTGSWIGWRKFTEIVYHLNVSGKLLLKVVSTLKGRRALRWRDSTAAYPSINSGHRSTTDY